MIAKHLSGSIACALLLAACSGAQGSSVPTAPGPVAPNAAAPAAHPRAVGPHATNVTVIVMENRNYSRIVGNANAPYINGTLIPQGALLKNYHAVAHPSEPNYLALFSGSTQGVQGDPCPLTFKSANIASELSAAGKSFGGYSESMPSNGFTGCYAGEYARKHSPWVNFTNVPASENLVYHGFPKSPPNLTWITPNLCSDMHDCSVGHGDAWLAKNVPPMLAWNANNDGVLIIVFDESAPDRSGKNRVYAELIGPGVMPGSTSMQNVDHYAMLRTMDDIFGVKCIKDDCKAPDITGIWQ